MGKILEKLRGHPRLYDFLKKIYGNTFGLWSIKELYLKHIGIWNGGKRLKLLSKSQGNNILSKAIRSNRPFMYARYGSSEFRAMMNEKDFPLVCFYSGFFPQDIKLREKFKKVYLKGIRYADMFGMWNYRNHFLNEVGLIKKFPNIKYIIQTFYIGNINDSWIRYLKGKKVLVIHPFKKTIEIQYKKREKLGILPKLKSLEIIKAVQTLGDNKDPRFETWFDALDYMKKEIDKKDFDIAIIGCGAYGLPLAAHVKSKGKQALHLAGKTQLLFGIKGKRWNKISEKLYNKYWIYPLEEDKMKDYRKIEGGCYW